MMKTAKWLKDCKGFTGSASLYELSEPVEYGWSDKGPKPTTSYVIVSATHALYTEPETYIFPANQEGEILDWSELDGSYRGGLSHDEALKDAGFTIIGIEQEVSNGITES